MGLEYGSYESGLGSGILHGLSRADLNGRKGRVLSWDDSKGRHGVRLDASPAPLAVKPSNLHRRCDGCEQLIWDWEGPAELEQCADCGYACCESCSVSRSRGVCRCDGSNFGRRPDGTPTKSDARCMCSSCKRDVLQPGSKTRARDRERRRAGLLTYGDDVAFLFRTTSGASVIRFGKTQRITCKCLATRKLEHAAYGGIDVRAAAAEQEVQILLLWYGRTAPCSYTFDGRVSHGQDMQYRATAMLGFVEFDYDDATRRLTLPEAQLRSLRARAVALATHAASAPDGVTVEGEELEDAGAAEEVSQAGAVDRAQTKALSSLPV